MLGKLSSAESVVFCFSNFVNFAQNSVEVFYDWQTAWNQIRRQLFGVWSGSKLLAKRQKIGYSMVRVKGILAIDQK